GIKREHPVPAQAGQQAALLRLRAARLPGLRFRYLAEDVEHEERRSRAHDEHAAPADVMEQQSEHHRGDQVAAGIASLQNAGDQAAGAHRHGLEGEGRADSPLAPHRDAVERPQRDEYIQRRREGGGELHDRVEQNAGHERRPAAITVTEAPKEKGAHRPHRQSRKERYRHRGDAGPEVHGQTRNDENDEKVIERIQHPSEEAGDHDTATLGAPRLARSHPVSAHVSLMKARDDIALRPPRPMPTRWDYPDPPSAPADNPGSLPPPGLR